MSARGFRLATVEKLRHRRLEEAAAQLHAAHSTVRAAQARRDDLLAQMHVRRPTTGTAHELELESVYRFRLRGDLAEVEDELTGLNQALARHRDAWLEARAQAHAVATLHEHHRRERRQAAERAEQRELDDRAGAGRALPAADGHDHGEQVQR